MKHARGSDVVEALHRFGLERERLRTALARRLAIPMTDLDALEHLESAGPQSQRELAQRLLLSSGAVTFLVDRLERAGLVSRQAHPTDRRTTLVTLNPGAALPEVPELDDYHAALRRTASELSATGSAAVIGYLSAVTAEAEIATKRLAGGR